MLNAAFQVLNAAFQVLNAAFQVLNAAFQVLNAAAGAKCGVPCAERGVLGRTG
jgi:hypothetical protein